MTKKSTLLRKLASYSGLASVALLAAKTSDAQIIYTDVIPDDTTSSPGSTTLDLNNDGTIDFSFNVFQSGQFAVVRVVGEGSNSITRDINLFYYAGYYYANALNAGDVIAGSQSFKSQEILGSKGPNNDYGDWPGVDAYLGLKVNTNSNTYYGWARAYVNAVCNQLIIHEYAMDTIPDESIKAGDKCGNYSALVNTEIIAPDPLGFCAGSNVGLSVDSLSGETYQWWMDGNLIDGATSPAILVDSAGDYTVIVTTANGCVDTSNTVNIAEFPLPDPPAITQTGSTMSTGEAISYQWYHNGDIIAGATDQEYETTEGGDYTVVITDANGCSSESAPFTFIPVGISNTETVSLNVFESNNILFIQLYDEKFLGGSIRIFSTVGDEVQSSLLSNKNSQLDLQHLSAGMYLLSIEKNSERFAKKIVIQ